jgi:hypothetical protein
LNRIEIAGVFDKEPTIRSIDRPTGSTELATASLTFTAQRGDKEVKMWVDIEAVGKKALELQDVPLNVPVKVTGALERAAWKDKQTEEWRSKHFIRYEDAEYAAVPESDIPF